MLSAIVRPRLTIWRVRLGNTMSWILSQETAVMKAITTKVLAAIFCLTLKFAKRRIVNSPWSPA
jgi:hypothetical protein